MSRKSDQLRNFAGRCAFVEPVRVVYVSHSDRAQL